jgi:hypothetical protein
MEIYTGKIAKMAGAPPHQFPSFLSRGVGVLRPWRLIILEIGVVVRVPAQ